MGQIMMLVLWVFCAMVIYGYHIDFMSGRDSVRLCCQSLLWSFWSMDKLESDLNKCIVLHHIYIYIYIPFITCAILHVYIHLLVIIYMYHASCTHVCISFITHHMYHVPCIYIDIYHLSYATCIKCISTYIYITYHMYHASCVYTCTPSTICLMGHIYISFIIIHAMNHIYMLCHDSFICLIVTYHMCHTLCTHIYRLSFMP